MKNMVQKKSFDHLILIHDSHWASNLGNPFFTCGAKYALEQACPSSIVLSTASLTLTGWGVKRGSRVLENDLNYIKYSAPDWFVLTGPLFNKNFANYYDVVFNKVLNNKKTKLVILSAGGIDYNDEEITKCRNFLKKYRPFILFTRDTHTFDSYSDLAECSYNGICTAFFAPDYYPGYPTPSLTPYISLTFDTIKEPSFDFTNFNQNNIYSYKTPEIILKPKGLFSKIVPEKLSKQSGIFTLVRPTHAVLNKPIKVLLNKKNAFFSMTPFGYLNIYRNTSLTLTDRVHACVVTLAYGKPARLYSRSKRTQLLERVGCKKTLEEVFQLDQNLIKQEKSNLIKNLEKIRTTFE